jgi:hypothetical protein
MGHQRRRGEGAIDIDDHGDAPGLSGAAHEALAQDAG